MDDCHFFVDTSNGLPLRGPRSEKYSCLYPLGTCFPFIIIATSALSALCRARRPPPALSATHKNLALLAETKHRKSSNGGNRAHFSQSVTLTWQLTRPWASRYWTPCALQAFHQYRAGTLSNVREMSLPAAVTHKQVLRPRMLHRRQVSQLATSRGKTEEQQLQKNSCHGCRKPKSCEKKTKSWQKRP